MQLLLLLQLIFFSLNIFFEIEGKPNASSGDEIVQIQQVKIYTIFDGKYLNICCYSLINLGWIKQYFKTTKSRNDSLQIISKLLTFLLNTNWKRHL